MKRKMFKMVVVACMVAGLIFNPAPFVVQAEDVFITIGGGDFSGVYFPAGLAIAEMINQKRPEYGIRATVEAEAQKIPLSGTAWRLVEIQSMDDAIGTVRPEDPSLYHMRLNSDGTVLMRLNCNRASGTWSAEAGLKPTSGRFTFGPLASTRYACPPPSLDERMSAEFGYVRSYLLKDGRLYLSLMADGGIYAWEPDTDTAFLTTPDKVLEAAIPEAEPDYTRDVPWK